MSGKASRPGVYLHLPFCSKICPYCDFYVLTGGPVSRQRFVELLIEEIRLCANDPWPDFVDDPPPEAFDTVYLGGGTPSRLTPEQLRAILESVADLLPATRQPWIGLEANPEDVSAEALAAWSDLGIGFLSLGGQSLDDRKLELLGRAHDAQTTRSSLEQARKSDIETLSLDLIYGLPGETPNQWRHDLESALELQPDHLSCYQLTIEPNTPFGFRQRQGRLVESSETTQAELFRLTHRFLHERGYAAYEVANFAADPHHRSRHNLKYWSRTPYLGLGPSAHSFAARQRWWNHRKLKPYSERVTARTRPVADHEDLDLREICLEQLMLGLRTPQGVDFAAFPGETGAQIWEANRPLIDELSNTEVVTVEGRHLRPTLAGLAVAEGIAARFDIEIDHPPPAAGIC